MSTLFSTLGSKVSTHFGHNYLDSTSNNGQSFFTSASGFKLGTITVDVDNLGGAAGTLTASIYSYTSTGPGTLITTVGSIDNALLPTTAGSPVSFKTSIVLAPKTQYYVVLTDTAADSVEWDYAPTPDKTTGIGKAGTRYVIGSGFGSGTPIATSKGGEWLMKVATCFASGSRIRTTRGDVAVEALVVGDLVVTACGAHRPIRWLGHRTIDCSCHPRPFEVAPVRVAAHAFGQGRPARDLYLSPGHPVLVGADSDDAGGHLVPIMCLVNGTTIERVTADEITYWHIELDAHDILLAEGLPAESYLDWGDRAFFTEGADHRLANPDFVVPGLAGRCRPVAIDGSVVEAERRRLDTVLAMRLAGACNWPSQDAAAFTW